MTVTGTKEGVDRGLGRGLIRGVVHGTRVRQRRRDPVWDKTSDQRLEILTRLGGEGSGVTSGHPLS